MYAIKLKTNRLVSPMGIDPGKAVFSWICQGGDQQAFRVQVSGDVEHDSGKVYTNQTEYTLPLAVPPKALCQWTVQLWDENGLAGEEKTAQFETGPGTEDWAASWIDPEPAEYVPAQDNQSLNRASYLRKVFTVAGGQRCRLYITAHGVYDAWINGSHVDGYFLAPGSSQYDERLQVQTYDVGSLLRPGENEILICLGDGWWRGCHGWSMRRNCWGERLALLCQLEVDGNIIACTDGTWQASQQGPYGLQDPMQLQAYDARRQISCWHGVCLASFGYENLVGTMLPVTAHERFPAKLLVMPNGDRVLDFGQNLAGFVALHLEAEGGEVIRLTHGEVLDGEGNFQIQNFQNSKEPYCTQQVEYICKPGENRWHQALGYYGFRYAKVETELPIDGSEFTAVAVYSHMDQTAFFTCGHKGVNRLFENCLWSMRSNFVDIPTDCPHREKAGFTGDLQVFSQAALYLMDCWPVLARYVLECAAGQRDDGCVRQIVPWWSAKGALHGAAGWSDAFEILTLHMLKAVPTTAVAESIYPALKRWMQFCLERAKPSRPENSELPRHIRDYFVDTATHWGEWCEPGRIPSDYFAERDQTGHAEIGTAYLAYGCACMAQIAKQLGYEKDSAFFAQESQKAAQAYRYIYLPDGKVCSDRQCHLVRPLAFDLVKPEDRANLAEDLVAMIRANGNRLGTGFLSTCYLCAVLCEHGHSQVAYDLLLQEQQPSWLFEVNSGATTVWESWFGIRPDQSRRGSHNHYAFGAVAGWLMGHAVGIRLEYGKFKLRPYPDKRLGYAEGIWHSPVGTVSLGWAYAEDGLHISVTVPANGMAELTLPDGTFVDLRAGSYDFVCEKESL